MLTIKKNYQNFSINNIPALTLSFFLLYLCIGLLIFNDFGISMDAANHRNDGIRNLNYIFTLDSSLLEHGNKYHGSVFAVLLTSAELILNISHSPSAIFLMRHLIIFLLFYISIIFFYKLIFQHYRCHKTALLGCLFLVLSPRIFAHSFYNPKDSITLSLFIIGIFTLVQFLANKTLKTSLIHSFVCAFTIDVRLITIILPVITLIFYCIDLSVNRQNAVKKNHTLLLSSFIVSLLIFIYLLWPKLWADPISSLTGAFIHFSKLPDVTTVYYFGKEILSNQLPWHYIPVWISITTPGLYLILFLVGLFSGLKNFGKNPASYYQTHTFEMICIVWFFVPLLGIIILKSNVYNAYRHLLFIYPALILLCIQGYRFIQSLFLSRKMKYAKPIRVLFTALIFLSLTETTFFMIRNHPHQNVYFNKLIYFNGFDQRENFDLDYWGISFKQGLENLVNIAEEEQISIVLPDDGYLLNAGLLSREARGRLMLCDGGPRYLLTNYRINKNIPYKKEALNRFGTLIQTISIDGLDILGVYKLKSENSNYQCTKINQYLNRAHMLGRTFQRN